MADEVERKIMLQMMRANAPAFGPDDDVDETVIDRGMIAPFATDAPSRTGLALTAGMPQTEAPRGTLNDFYAILNGATGVVDHYTGHIPSTLAGVASGTGRYLSGEKWWEAYPDALNRARSASKNALADFARRHSRDVAGLSMGEHGASPLHSIIVTLPMAMRKGVQQYLHPDDIGGMRRQEAALNEYANAKSSGAPVGERADIMRQHWTDNGVGFFHPDASGDVKTYTSAAVPDTQKLTTALSPGTSIQKPLSQIYDDPLLYAAHPDAAGIKTQLTLSGGSSGGASTFDGKTGNPKAIEARATRQPWLENVVAHEATHITASNPANALPQGSRIDANMDTFPKGMTGKVLDDLDEREAAAVAAFNEGRSYNGRDPRQELIAIEDYRSKVMGMMNYLDSRQNPGEYLARMEQLAHRARQLGDSPFARSLDEIDDLDLRTPAGLDFRDYRMVPKGQRP